MKKLRIQKTCEQKQNSLCLFNIARGDSNQDFTIKIKSFSVAQSVVRMYTKVPNTITELCV